MRWTHCCDSVEEQAREGSSKKFGQDSTLLSNLALASKKMWFLKYYRKMPNAEYRRARSIHFIYFANRIIIPSHLP
jgi:hypothetical protein